MELNADIGPGHYLTLPGQDSWFSAWDTYCKFIVSVHYLVNTCEHESIYKLISILNIFSWIYEKSKQLLSEQSRQQKPLQLTSALYKQRLFSNSTNDLRGITK